MANRGSFITYELTKGVDILGFIHAKYQSKIKAEDLRDHTGLTEKMLQRLLKKLTGRSIHQYLEDYRLSKAIEELLRPDNFDIKISSIAKRHGYRSDKYFYRVFKRKTGLTPDEFRARHFQPSKEPTSF